MRVSIPTPLYSYTGGRWVVGQGATLNELLQDLDRQYPGVRFRVVDEQDQLRGHMRFFVNGEQTFRLDHPLRDGDEVTLVQALSGG